MPKKTKSAFNLRDPTLPPPKRKRSQLSKLTYKTHEAPWKPRIGSFSMIGQTSKKFGDGDQKPRMNAPLRTGSRSFRNIGDESKQHEMLEPLAKEPNSPTLKASDAILFEDQNDDDEAPPPEIDEFIDLMPQRESSRVMKKDDQAISLPPQSTIFTKQREIAEHRVKKMRKQSLSLKKRAYEDVIDFPL